MPMSQLLVGRGYLNLYLYGQRTNSLLIHQVNNSSELKSLPNPLSGYLCHDHHWELSIPIWKFREDTGINNMKIRITL